MNQYALVLKKKNSITWQKFTARTDEEAIERAKTYRDMDGIKNVYLDKHNGGIAYFTIWDWSKGDRILTV